MKNFETVCGIGEKELIELESTDNMFDGVAFNEYGEHDIFRTSISDSPSIYDPEVENVVSCVEGAMYQVMYSVEGENRDYL